MKLLAIREMFWPLLELPDNKPSLQIQEDSITLSDEENLKTAYDWAVKYYESEEERSRSIDAKSTTIFIGAVGFLIVILLAITQELLIATGFQSLVSVVMFSIIIIYFCRVVCFAIKALGRKNYYKIDYDDFITKDESYRKRLITILVNNANKNEKVVNLKVDYMTMAQEYFKRSVWVFAIYSILLIIFGVYKNKDYIMSAFYRLSTVAPLSDIFIALIIFIGGFIFYKNAVKILKKANSMKRIFNPFWGKMIIPIIFITFVYILYITMSMCTLRVVERVFGQNANECKLCGFFVMIAISITVASRIYKLFKKEVLEITEYFKLWAGFVGVFVPVVTMYIKYYMSEVPQVSQPQNVLTVVCSNEGIFGVPLIILLTSFIVACGELKEREKKKIQNQNDKNAAKDGLQ